MDDRSANAIRELDDFGVAESLGAADGAEPLFVINLCAAMTPQNLDDVGIPGLDRYKLYQVSRMEDGRRRYRLRLGFFTTEADAEEVLVSVRSRYATAFTACLCDEDLKYASGYLKRSIQDLARTGRFKIPAALKPDNTKPVAKAPDAKPVAAVKEVAKQQPKAAEVIALETPKSVAQEIAKEILQASPAKPKAPAMKAPAAKPEVKTAETKSVAAAKPAITASKVAVSKTNVMSEAESHARHIKAQLKSLEDTSSGAVEITWVPDQLDASPAQPVGSSVPRTAATAVAPASAAVIQTKPSHSHANGHGHKSDSQRKDPVHKAAASDKTAPTLPPAVNLAAAKNAAASLTLEKAPAVSVPATKKPATPAAPFHVGAGVKIPDMGLSLANESAAKPAPVAAKPAQPKPQQPAQPKAVSAPITKPASPPPSVVPSMARPMSTWRNGGDDVPTLDTTQTIRDLTQTELDDVQGLKWFVVQLALSDQPVNLDTMPRLDIFEAYSLYSVALLQDGTIKHALRLGFFSEQVSAEAVLGYLKTFFNAPTVERISVAEHKRFSEEQSIIQPESDVKSSARVITLEEKRPAPPTTLSELRSQTAAKPATGKHSAKSVPTIHEAVAAPAIVPTSQVMYRTSGKYAAPAVKRSSVVTNGPKKAASKSAGDKNMPLFSQEELLAEAQSLGLSDTQIIRVQKNPSLLSRLVGKLTK